MPTGEASQIAALRLDGARTHALSCNSKRGSAGSLKWSRPANRN